MLANGLLLGNTPLFTLGHEPTFFPDRTHFSAFGDFFAESPD